MDIDILRQEFKTYMQERFPNDRNISSTVSMAFFLVRYGDELDIDFQKVLSNRAIPTEYKQKLEMYFITRGRKNPRANASVYERSLRLLLEYLDGKPYIAVNQEKAIKKSSSFPRKSVVAEVPCPTKQAVNDYLKKWTELPDYSEQEAALHLLFHDTFHGNDNLSAVLLKCSTLNDFYGTNIFKIYPLAKHIVSLNIDDQLTRGDPQLVNDISEGHGIKSRSGKELHLFSFATKYCSHHNPNDFPIFDSYVEKLLLYFRNVDRFSAFTSEELRDYKIFKKVILDFRKAYHLQDFNLKQIDQYLWQLGKEVFPKRYGKGK